MDTCTKCGHRSDESIPASYSRLRALLGLPQQPGRCGHVEVDAGGWSSGIECGCRHRVHRPASG